MSTIPAVRSQRLRPDRFAKSLTDKLTEGRTYSYYGNLRGLAYLAAMKGKLTPRGFEIVLDKLQEKYREIKRLSIR